MIRQDANSSRYKLLSIDESLLRHNLSVRVYQRTRSDKSADGTVHFTDPESKSTRKTKQQMWQAMHSNSNEKKHVN